ncbi:MAG: tRNA (adenosine(37)-N6)-threonylcarbamoyltransferase complex transferase subunit TsaD [Candidatus Dormibacteria bacterium]
MLTLGIESSCDETSVALVEDGRRILSNVVSSQVVMHAAYGGVVPELAARQHLERLPGVTDLALKEAGRTLDQVALVAVTRGPGLVGALLVGVGFARGLATEIGRPVVGVSHLDGHLHSAFLGAAEPVLPMLVLLVSGGHTEMVLVTSPGEYMVLGRTLDDAAGEAFDKVARLLGLPYPGGPEVERQAAQVEVAEALTRFPLPAIRTEGLNFSFSGIKTAVRYRLERLDAGERGDPGLVASAAAAFQHRAIEHLVKKLVLAFDQVRPQSVAIAGGVAGSRALRLAAGAALHPEGGRRDRQGRQLPSPVVLAIPPASLCTDNAAMIAAAGHHLWLRGGGSSLEVDAGLRLG